MSNRKRDRDELLGDAFRVLQSLVEGVSRMDAGDPIGVDHAAQAARHLVGTGRGDNLLKRVRTLFHVESPLGLALTHAVKIGDRSIVFALGALPIIDSHVTGASTASSLDEFLDADTVLLDDGTHQVLYTKRELVTVVANKLAVHTDDEIPRYVEELCSYRVGGVPVLRFVLRTTAAVVAKCAIEELAGLDSSLALEPPPMFKEGSPWIGYAQIATNRQSKLDVVVLASFPEGEIVGYEPGSVAWLHHPPGGGPIRYPKNSNPGRNDPCPCGSGLKFKRCHGIP